MLNKELQFPHLGDMPFFIRPCTDISSSYAHNEGVISDFEFCEVTNYQSYITVNLGSTKHEFLALMVIIDNLSTASSRGADMVIVPPEFVQLEWTNDNYRTYVERCAIVSVSIEQVYQPLSYQYDNLIAFDTNRICSNGIVFSMLSEREDTSYLLWDTQYSSVTQAKLDTSNIDFDCQVFFLCVIESDVGCHVFIPSHLYRLNETQNIKVVKIPLDHTKFKVYELEV